MWFAPVNLNDNYNSLAQKAAFIILANNKVSDFPDTNWKCYSEVAAKAARRSSLTFTDFAYHKPTAFISGFVEDYGDENNSAPHRRSLLYSKAEERGYGATMKTEAIYDEDKLGKSSKTFPKLEYIAYPVKGYNEIDLVYARWSFGIPDDHKVDFSKAEVNLTDEKGKVISIRVLPYEGIYDPTIVWVLTDKIKRSQMLNKTITVSIKNVIFNEVERKYEYAVMFF